MECVIYDIELLQFKKEVLKEFKFEFKNKILEKVKTNSKAYIELEDSIKNTNKKIQILEDEIKYSLDGNKTKYSNIKICTETLKKIIDLTNELKVDSISMLLDLLVDNYKELILLDQLTKVIPMDINKNKQILLNNTSFYISKKDNTNEILIYKLDDLIIHNNTEYLNISKFKEYAIGVNIFLFSTREY